MTREAFILMAQLRVGSRVCAPLISRPSKWSALLRPFGARQHNFTPALAAFSLRSLLPAESCGHSGILTLTICPGAFPPILLSKSLPSLHFCLLNTHIVTHLMGFALHGNAGLRCCEIEKMVGGVFGGGWSFLFASTLCQKLL